jgi:hypothetical protein
MKYVIHKYKLNVPGYCGRNITEIRVTDDYRILSVGLDGNGDVCVWVMVKELVEDSIEEKILEILLLGIGISNYNPVNPKTEFLGTVNQDGFMWHCFKLD